VLRRAFRSSGPPTEPRQRTRPSHLELGLQLLALEPGGDGHDVLHPRRLVPCSTPTRSPPLDQRPTPPGNRDPGRGDPSLPERSGLVRRKAPAAEESGAARAAEAAGAAGVEAAAAAARRRAGARVWTRRHMVVGGAGLGSSLSTAAAAAEMEMGSMRFDPVMKTARGGNSGPENGNNH